MNRAAPRPHADPATADRADWDSCLDSITLADELDLRAAIEDAPEAHPEVCA